MNSKLMLLFLAFFIFNSSLNMNFISLLKKRQHSFRESTVREILEINKKTGLPTQFQIDYAKKYLKEKNIACNKDNILDSIYSILQKDEPDILTALLVSSYSLKEEKMLIDYYAFILNLGFMPNLYVTVLKQIQIATKSIIGVEKYKDSKEFYLLVENFAQIIIRLAQASDYIFDEYAKNWIEKSSKNPQDLYLIKYSFIKYYTFQIDLSSKEIRDISEKYGISQSSENKSKYLNKINSLIKELNKQTKYLEDFENFIDKLIKTAKNV